MRTVPAVILGRRTPDGQHAPDSLFLASALPFVNLTYLFFVSFFLFREIERVGTYKGCRLHKRTNSMRDWGQVIRHAEFDCNITELCYRVPRGWSPGSRYPTEVARLPVYPTREHARQAIDRPATEPCQPLLVATFPLASVADAIGRIRDHLNVG